VQSEHEVAPLNPSVEVPISQTVQSSAESWAAMVRPSSARYEPATQRVHVKAPDDGEYEPAGQTWQLPSLPLKVPAWHLQSSTLSWEVTMPSSAMTEPAGHSKHVPVPVFEAYESAGHTEHGPASAEKLPAAQRPQETQDPPFTSAGVLVPSEPGPQEQSMVPLFWL
jgi:hypothetical protein